MRKILLALAAFAVAGTAAAAVTVLPAAAAQWHNHNHRHHIWRPSVRYFAPPVYTNCYVRRVIHTPFGPRVELINRCY